MIIQLLNQQKRKRNEKKVNSGNLKGKSFAAKTKSTVLVAPPMAASLEAPYPQHYTTPYAVPYTTTNRKCIPHTTENRRCI